MKSVAEIIPGAINQDNTLICNICGNKVEFSGKQWRRPCGRCGTIITLPRLRIMAAEQEKPAPVCFVCFDRGVVYYQEQVGDISYEYCARCFCRAGEESEKRGLPRVDEVDNIVNLKYLEMKNRQEWEKRTGRKAEPVLFAGIEEVEVGREEIPF